MDEMEKMLKEINVEETLRETDENIDFEELDKEWARNLDELDNLWSDNIRELSKWWIIKGDKGDILKKGIFENLKRRGHLLIDVFLFILRSGWTPSELREN